MDSEDLHYRMQLLDSLSEIRQQDWDKLIAQQNAANPFLSYAFLSALESSGSASPDSGWTCRFLCLWRDEELAAALPLYEKMHSYGEYVFDWAWANAYRQHGLDYYPKLLSAIPFTPVSGNRLLAQDEAARRGLIQAIKHISQLNLYSSAHILFLPQEEALQMQEQGFLLREGVQFHWKNQGYADFEEFLAQLEFKKRKNIRAERRKVQEAGVSFRHLEGTQIQGEDWEFFKTCYDNTYAQHHSSPYLNLEFFLKIGQTMPDQIHLILAYRNDKPIAASLLIHDQTVLFGRYWGCTEYVPCLHFETAYYQALEFCIRKGIQSFEGGAQGEHKMARGFLPHTTYSVHYLQEPMFYKAVADFLRREQHGISEYIDELNEHSPFK